MHRIYLDHAATTPLDPGVLEAMQPYLQREHGNASSLHREGRAARDAVEGARERVAGLLGVAPAEVLFTSGGTESDNTAVFGIARARADVGRHIVTSAVEHPAVLQACEALVTQGWQLDVLGVDAAGRVDPAALGELLTPQTTLVSVMAVNNEVGTVQPIEALGARCRAAGVTFHTDAVQALGLLPIDLGRLPVDAASLSGHKIHGPKGVGVLVLRSGTPLVPLLVGGGHELGRRAGTENVAAIVGFARALELAGELRAEASARVAGLRDRLRDGILARIPQVTINTPETGVAPHLLNVSFAHVEGEAILLMLNARGVAVATGSACSSASLEPSSVLRAMGLPDVLAQGSIRFSLGRGTTRDEVDAALEAACESVARLRELSPLYEG